MYTTKLFVIAWLVVFNTTCVPYAPAPQSEGWAAGDPPHYTEPVPQLRPNITNSVGDPTGMVGAQGLQKQMENSYRRGICQPACTGSTFGDSQMEVQFYNELNKMTQPPPYANQQYQDFRSGPNYPGYQDFRK